jgi:hypothetical protein
MKLSLFCLLCAFASVETRNLQYQQAYDQKPFTVSEPIEYAPNAYREPYTNELGASESYRSENDGYGAYVFQQKQHEADGRISATSITLIAIGSVLLLLILCRLGLFGYCGYGVRESRAIVT